MGKNSNRGTNPSVFTKMVLCANAAGRCEFEGCNKYLFEDYVTRKNFNGTNLAHIIASSPDGPRGDEKLSYELSDKLENLMLLCPEHHKLIDESVAEYSVEKLRAMKQKHEGKIKQLGTQIGLPEAMIVRFISPIKNSNPSNIAYFDAVEAIEGENIPAGNDGGLFIKLECTQDYRSELFWKEVTQQLSVRFNATVKNQLEITPHTIFSIFPLAPIPLIAYFGFLIGDKIKAKVYQKTRTPDTWKWQTQENTNNFSYIYEHRPAGRGVAIIMSVSAEVNQSDVLDAYDAEHLFTINALRKDVDAIKSEEDLSCFWHVYQEICNRINLEFSEFEKIAIFPAIPVSAAFEIGRRYMPGVYPKLEIYDKFNGFFKTIEFGGK